MECSLSYEAEFRLPSKTMYAYVNIKVTGNSLEEFRHKVGEVSAEASLLGAVLDNSIALFNLGEGGVSGTVVYDAVNADAEASPPWLAPPTTPTNPWDTTPPAKVPWEVAGPQSGPTKVLIKLPFVKEGDPNYEGVRSFKNYFFQQRNKLEFNKERKGFEFTNNPPAPELLAMARQGAAQFGGSVVE